MNEVQDDPAPAVGLRRFHKLTMSAGIGFLLLMAIRYGRLYAAESRPLHLVFLLVAVVLAVVLFLYLRRFARGGSLD